MGAQSNINGVLIEPTVATPGPVESWTCCPARSTGRFRRPLAQLQPLLCQHINIYQNYISFQPTTFIGRIWISRTRSSGEPANDGSAPIRTGGTTGRPSSLMQMSSAHPRPPMHHRGARDVRIGSNLESFNQPCIFDLRSADQAARNTESNR